MDTATNQDGEIAGTAVVGAGHAGEGKRFGGVFTGNQPPGATLRELRELTEVAKVKIIDFWIKIKLFTSPTPEAGRPIK